MKKITFLTLLGFLIFSSCTPEVDLSVTPEITEEEREEDIKLP